MAIEWQMVREHQDDPHLIAKWLQEGWEPFAATSHHVFLKKVAVTDRSEKSSELTKVEVDHDVDSGGAGRVGEDSPGEEASREVQSEVSEVSGTE